MGGFIPPSVPWEASPAAHGQTPAPGAPINGARSAGHATLRYSHDTHTSLTYTGPITGEADYSLSTSDDDVDDSDDSFSADDYDPRSLEQFEGEEDITPDMPERLLKKYRCIFSCDFRCRHMESGVSDSRLKRIANEQFWVHKRSRETRKKVSKKRGLP